MQYSLRCLYLLLILASPILFACNSSSGEDRNDSNAQTTFILVRHAEKAGGEDPDLTEEGKARARRLANRLSSTPITAVYSTDTRRTQATAAPTATAKSLIVKDYSPGNLASFAEKLKQTHQGESVLIVGHSNTTPDLANYLSGGNKAPRISEGDYGNIITVSIPSSGKARLKTARY